MNMRSRRNSTVLSIADILANMRRGSATSLTGSQPIRRGIETVRNVPPQMGELDIGRRSNAQSFAPGMIRGKAFPNIPNDNYRIPGFVQRERMRRDIGAYDPTPSVNIDAEKDALREIRRNQGMRMLTDMPGQGAAPGILQNVSMPMPSSVSNDIGNMMVPPVRKEESDQGVMPRPSDDRRQGTVPLPRRRPSNTRPPDAIGPPVPAVKPIPRPMPKPQMDTGKDAELDAGIDQKVDAEKDNSFKFDPNMDLVSLGLQVAAAASKPGATFLGSIAQGGLNHLNEKQKRELIKEDREYKKSVMKMEQNFTRTENSLTRAKDLDIAQSRIGILNEQNKISSASLAETIRKNTKMLEIQLAELPTEKQKEAEGRLLETKIRVQDATSAYYTAKAEGEGDALKIQEETTKREYIRAALKLINIDKIDVMGKTEAEKTAIYKAEVGRALTGIEVLQSSLDKFLPGVADGVKRQLETGGGGDGQDGPRFTPGQEMTQNGIRYRVDANGTPQPID